MSSLGPSTITGGPSSLLRVNVINLTNRFVAGAEATTTVIKISWIPSTKPYRFNGLNNDCMYI